MNLFPIRRKNNKVERIKSLYEKYEHNLLLVAKNKLYFDAELAEDAVQEAFKRLLRSKVEIYENNSGKAYVFAVLENVCNDMLKKKNKIDTHEVSDEKIIEASFATPDDIIIGKELRVALKRILKKLDSTYREVLMLKIASEKSTKEIADILGMSEENVRVKLHRARSIIYKELEKEGLVDARRKK